MKNQTHIWLIRIYALVIIIVLFGGFLEKAALNIVIAVSSFAIIGWSFLIR